MSVFSGVAAAPGIGIGPVQLLKPHSITVPRFIVSANHIALEKSRFQNAREKTRLALKKIENRVKKNLGSDQAAIFHAHMLILEDVELIQRVTQVIEKKRLNAAAALQEVTDKMAEAFQKTGDHFLRDRVLDIRDVSQRILSHLLNLKNQEGPEKPGPGEAVILVAHTPV